MKKVYSDAKSALAGVLKDGMLICAGGFGLCGIPETLILAIRDSGVKNLTIVSNNAGVDGAGLGLLLETRQVKKMISSYVGENKLFAQQFLANELEIEFNPQGTLAGMPAPPARASRPSSHAPEPALILPKARKSGNLTASVTSWSAALSRICRSCTHGWATTKAILCIERPRAISIR